MKPLPSYRVYGCLSPMFDLGLYVTDRRILTIAYAARLLTQEFSQWFDGRTPPEDGEVVKAVRSERWGSLPYLEVISGNPLTNCVFVSDVSPQIAACSMVAEEEE